MSRLSNKGCIVVDNYLSAEECGRILEEILDYRKHNELPEISRPMKDRPLRYKVIDGQVIQERFPSIWNLYTGPLLDFVRKEGNPDMELLDNQKVGVNVNIMDPQGSTYRWHYDRNAVTGILYLNEVEGGETELFPNYRILIKNKKLDWLQRFLDRVMHIPFIRRLFVERMVIPPATGKLILMAGHRSWHSVRPVYGDEERINIILSYDISDGSSGMNESLDQYLYTQQGQQESDPNYKA